MKRFMLKQLYFIIFICCTLILLVACQTNDDILGDNTDNYRTSDLITASITVSKSDENTSESTTKTINSTPVFPIVPDETKSSVHATASPTPSSTTSPSTTSTTTVEELQATATPSPTSIATTVEEPAASATPSPTAIPLESNTEPEIWLSSFLDKHQLDPDQLGLVYMDQTTGETFSHNEDGAFIAASTIKVPMAMYTLDQVHRGLINLDMELGYKESLDYERGSGLLQFTIEDGDRISLETCIELAIRNSDNIATNMIFRYWRERPESQSLTLRMNQAYGLAYDGNASMTAGSMAKVLKQLFDNQNQNPHYDLLITHMKNTTFDSYVTRDIPNGLYAHKFGLYGGSSNDIGIVYGERPFIFSVYTKNLNDPSEILSEIGAYFCSYANQ